jgi:hypothetical protein
VIDTQAMVAMIGGAGMAEQWMTEAVA